MGSLFLAGHNGMVGQAIRRRFRGELLIADRSELDLTNQKQVSDFFSQNDIESVVLAAARVGGIGDNVQRPTEFGYDNAMIICNVLHSALESGVRRLLFLGSSCMYPRGAPQPMKEELLMQGPLEPTNEMYGLAKIFGVKLCEVMSRQHGVSYNSLIPCNLYGPHDHFWTDRAHVVPSLMRRMHHAKVAGDSVVTVWGDGTPLRELMHVDDLAAAVLWALDYEQTDSYLNCGSSEEVSIRELVLLMKEVVGFEGEIRFDESKPNGMPRKVVDSSRIHTHGWRPVVSLEEGLKSTYEWFLHHDQKELGVV